MEQVENPTNGNEDTETTQNTETQSKSTIKFDNHKYFDLIESLKSGHPKHFIILVRHGERSDDPEREILSENDRLEPQVKFDCHLTDKGSKQAFQTGEFIKEQIIEANNLDFTSSDIKVFTSPFLRCIQTVSEIIDGMGYKVPNITINDRLGEFLLKSWFDSIEKPLAHLTINHVKHSKFQQNYLGKESKFKFTRFYGQDATPNEFDSNVVEEDPENCVTAMESNTVIKYPETYSDMFYRYSGIINEIIYQEFFENAEEISQKSKIVLIVSHGFSVDPFINAFCPDHPNVVSVDYCATSIAEKLSNEENFELILKGDAKHCGLNPATF